MTNQSQQLRTSTLKQSGTRPSLSSNAPLRMNVLRKLLTRCTIATLLAKWKSNSAAIFLVELREDAPHGYSHTEALSNTNSLMWTSAWPSSFALDPPSLTHPVFTTPKASQSTAATARPTAPLAKRFWTLMAITVAPTAPRARPDGTPVTAVSTMLLQVRFAVRL